MVGYVDDMMRELEYRKQQDAIKNREYLIDYLRKAREELVSVGNKFAETAIRDSALRQVYAKNIKRVADDVVAEVNAGKMYARDGAKFCFDMRNKIMAEIRKLTSPMGLAEAERLKRKAPSFDKILETNSQKLFGKSFSKLNTTEVNKVFYATITSSGRNRPSVTAATKKLAIAGSVALVVTAILAVWAICEADDKIRESINQASILTGSAIGGSLAGNLARFATLGEACGPYAAACILGIMILGAIIGGILGDITSDTFEEEAAEFIRWQLI
ncbi:MAG: hypothetical protein RR569_07755 [Acinetobacter sp.]